MAATEVLLGERYQVRRAQSESVLEVLRVISGMLLRGCFHQEMSRPFTLAGETHRVCLNCGARRRFDTGRWAMYGPYFFEAGKAAGHSYMLHDATDLPKCAQ